MLQSKYFDSTKIGVTNQYCDKLLGGAKLPKDNILMGKFAYFLSIFIKSLILLKILSLYV